MFDRTPISNGSRFRNIFLIESREAWEAIQPEFDERHDLLLTYDFGLRKKIEEKGGTARYVDHLCEQSFMQENNFLMYQFFQDWHLDARGEDIFRYRGVDFGFSFRIEIWNDFTFHVRSRLCLEKVRTLNYEQIYIDTGLIMLMEILDDMELPYNCLERVRSNGTNQLGYFFPIHRWMNERLRTRQPKHILRDIVVTMQGITMSWIDLIFGISSKKTGVFVQEYYPTRQLLKRLLKHPGIRVMQAHFSAESGFTKYIRERPIPVYGWVQKYKSQAVSLLQEFHQRRSASLILVGGIDITDSTYRTIERKIIEVLPKSLRSLECVIKYMDRHPLKLEILIGNVGQLAMLVDCVAKSRGVPSYLIINGLMGNEFLDEAKYATVINGYSQSIRDNYFREMENVVCLGDPRMDIYSDSPIRKIDRQKPTVTIGASGFNNIDLNSYLAVEFEYLADVLSALNRFKQEDRISRITIKVRANGYLHSYRQFINEYFPGLVDEIYDSVEMKSVLEKTDLFISLHSQTLFEASCLGIPCIYHKNDVEVLDPPFNGKSEIVTTSDVNDLMQSIKDFLENKESFNTFMNKGVMEKYIGPLDGQNLDRNFNFVMQLLDKEWKKGSC